MTTSRVEETLTNIDGLVKALLFIGEHAEDRELPDVRSWAIALCYMADDSVQQLRAMRLTVQPPPEQASH